MAGRTALRLPQRALQNVLRLIIFARAISWQEVIATPAGMRVTKTTLILVANSSAHWFLLAVEVCTSVRGQSIQAVRDVMPVVGCVTTITRTVLAISRTVVNSALPNIYSFQLIVISVVEHRWTWGVMLVVERVAIHLLLAVSRSAHLGHLSHTFALPFDLAAVKTAGTCATSQIETHAARITKGTQDS